MIEGLKPYAEYKESGLPWLGRVPRHWEVRRAKASIANVVDQTTLMEANDVYVALENIESWTGRVRPQSGSSLFTGQVKRFRPNDVLFGKLRPYLAKVTRWETQGVCVGELFVLRPRNGAIIPEFLELLLRAKTTIDVINSSTFGAKMPRADWQFVGNLQINFPPPDEQTAIVRFLDHANRKIDGFIRAKRKLIGLLNEQKQAIIHRAVTRGLHPEVPLKPSGNVWLGDIPSHWEMHRAKFLFEQVTPPIPEDAGQVTCFRDGQVTLRSNRRTTGFTNAIYELGYQGIKPGQLVLHSMDAFAGAIGICDSHGKCSPEYVICEPTMDGVYSPYFARLLRTLALQGLFVALCPSVRQRAPRVRFNDFGGFSLPKPPETEQQLIVEHIECETAALTTAIARTEREIALMQEYRTRLTADLVTAEEALEEVEEVETEETQV